MKFLIVLALAVAVSAEADPYFYTYGAPVHTPFMYNTHYIKPVSYHAQSAGVSHTVHKREAEPLHYGYASYPYAHTAYAYGHHAAVYPFGVKTATYSNDAVSPYGYAAKGRYVANSAGVVHVAKREADPYMYYSHMPYSYTSAIHTPYVASPVVHTPYVATPFMPKTYSNDAHKPFNYAAKGTYHADSVGAKHIAKRDAEAYGFYTPSVYGAYHTAGFGYHTPSGFVKPYPHSYIKHF